MTEALSARLRTLLLQLGLCSQADLRRAGRTVRRLSRDLPAFDSVWLDALVRAGRLSPFQARLLESPRPEQIRIGPCVLFGRIGGGPLGQTYVARPVGGGEPCAIKVLAAADRLTPEVDERLQRVIGDVKSVRHPSLVAPHACDRADGRLVLVSRYVSGPTLGEMLVRRGRYPAAAVVEIGRQLIDGLAALAKRGYAHGDIRAANVRLTSGGVAVLVDAAVRPVLDAELSLHSGLPPDRYDGVAPELIGTGRSPDASSDIYALGCLLWHLLAGRPPFPGGDPLAKLAAHQTRTIDDVRKWAPDTPPAVAQALARWTARDPADRPVNWEEIGRHWGFPRPAGRRVLKRFLNRFREPAVPPAPGISRTTRWAVAAALIFALSGAALLLDDLGARNRLLSWTTRYVPASWNDGTLTNQTVESRDLKISRTTVAPDRQQADGHELPAPDSRGVIHLDQPGPYHPADITAVGALSIVGSDDTPAEILLADKPLKLWAESVKIRNVRFIWRGSSTRGTRLPAALLLVQSQQLEIERCRFDSPTQALDEVALASNTSQSNSEGAIAVAWKLLDPRDLRGGTGAMRNCVFLGDAAAVYLAGPIRQLGWMNCLKIGRGPLVHLAAGPSANRDIRLELSSTTCRAAGPVLRWTIPTEWTGKGHVRIDANDSVFEAASGASLFEFVAAAFRSNMATAVQMTGTGSLAPSDVSIATQVNPADGTVRPLDPAQFQIEGLIAAPFEFHGPVSPRISDSELQSCDAPRSSTKLPGISAK